MSKLRKIIEELQPEYPADIEPAIEEITKLIEKENLATEIRTYKKIRPYLGSPEYNTNRKNLDKRIARLEKHLTEVEA